MLLPAGPVPHMPAGPVPHMSRRTVLYFAGTEGSLKPVIEY